MRLLANENEKIGCSSEEIACVQSVSNQLQLYRLLPANLLSSKLAVNGEEHTVSPNLVGSRPTSSHICVPKSQPKKIWEYTTNLGLSYHPGSCGNTSPSTGGVPCCCATSESWNLEVGGMRSSLLTWGLAAADGDYLEPGLARHLGQVRPTYLLTWGLAAADGDYLEPGLVRHLGQVRPTCAVLHHVEAAGYPFPIGVQAWPALTATRQWLPRVCCLCQYGHLIASSLAHRLLDCCHRLQQQLQSPQPKWRL